MFRSLNPQTRMSDAYIGGATSEDVRTRTLFFCPALFLQIRYPDGSGEALLLTHCFCILGRMIFGYRDNPRMVGSSFAERAKDAPEGRERHARGPLQGWYSLKFQHWRADIHETACLTESRLGPREYLLGGDRCAIESLVRPSPPRLTHVTPNLHGTFAQVSHW